MIIARCLDLLVLHSDLASLSLYMVPFYVLPWLFRSPQCSFFRTVSSCLITSVLESLSGSSLFFGNADINPLQHPLIKLFFSCPSQTGILSKSCGGDSGILSCFPPPICTSYLEKWGSGLKTAGCYSSLKTFWSFSVFCYGFKTPGSVSIIHVPHSTAPLEGANSSVSW